MLDKTKAIKDIYQAHFGSRIKSHWKVSHLHASHMWIKIVTSHHLNIIWAKEPFIHLSIFQLQSPFSFLQTSCTRKKYLNNKEESNKANCASINHNLSIIDSSLLQRRYISSFILANNSSLLIKYLIDALFFL